MRKDLRSLLNNERAPVTQRLMIGRCGRGRTQERAAARATVGHRERATRVLGFLLKCGGGGGKLWGGSMFSWMGRQAGGRERSGGMDAVQTVTGGLRSLYQRKVLPLEEAYRFHEFHSPALEDADFENKPMILLVGQYSTGKTTFIR
jgi:hypothetical protein